ncbi:MAG: hypothetical protein Q4A92_00475 [Corynebacterium sp.]|nr:hypothetical protein [Corynebacterium sp.]
MRKITRNSVVAGTILLSTLALAACGETKSADSSSTPATSSSMDKMEKDDKMEMEKDKN